jgi:hypothetical protein
MRSVEPFTFMRCATDSRAALPCTGGTTVAVGAPVPIRTPPQASTATQLLVDRQETPSIAQASVPVALHALAPPVGLFVITTFPSPSPATHSNTDGHDTASNKFPLPSGESMAPTGAQTPAAGLVELVAPPCSSTATQRVPAQEMAFSAPASMLFTVQAAAPPVGSVELRAFPAPSTATHRVVDEQDTPVSVFEPSTLASLHAVAPPPGSVDVSTLPESSTATHNPEDGHEIEASEFAPSIELACHAAEPPPGLVEASTFPELSTATHSVAAGHEIEVTELLPSTSAADQAVGPAPGSVELTTSPLASTAKHWLAAGQETALRALPAPASSWAETHDAADPAGVVEVITDPPSSAAAQKPAVGHEMASTDSSLDRVVRVHAGAPPAGSLE